MTRNVAKSAKKPEEFRFFQPPANALKALAVVPLTPQGRSRTTSHSLVREYLIRTGVEGDRTRPHTTAQWLASGRDRENLCW